MIPRLWDRNFVDTHILKAACDNLSYCACYGVCSFDEACNGRGWTCSFLIIFRGSFGGPVIF